MSPGHEWHNLNGKWVRFMASDSGHEKKRRREVVIRQMEIDDIASVYHLGERLFTSEELPILYRTWDQYEVTDYFSSDPDYCLVAEVDGEIVGFVLATTIEKEGTAWKRYGYLSWMGVDERFQRSKLGRRLYKKLEERLQEDGVRMVIADTEGDNQGAISFFNAIGFSVRGDHLWLAKTLRRRAKATTGVPRGPSPADAPG
jgi:ribosomal protein S18 acetylase RimI-like enzyme